MTRDLNWQNNLAELIESNRDKPFDFPAHNCLMWALSGIAAINGDDHSKAYRGKYKDEKEAAKLLRKVDKVKTSQELLELKLNQTVQPIAFARMGDIVLAKPDEAGLELPADTRLFGLVPGICYGQLSYFVGEFGLISVETLRLSGALWVS